MVGGRPGSFDSRERLPVSSLASVDSGRQRPVASRRELAHLALFVLELLHVQVLEAFHRR